MDGENILCRGEKYQANSLPNQNKRLLRKKVYISDDIWLVALKFLRCPQWSTMRYVCPQINGIVERNILRLPKMVLDKGAIYYIHDSHQELTEELKKLSVDQYTIVAFDTTMQKEQNKQWFVERGFTLQAPADTTAENAIINASREWKSNINVCILGTPQKNILLSEQEKRFPWFRIRPYGEAIRKPVLFYAQFNPVSNQYSWDYLAQFLKYIFHPTSYIKEVEMFAVKQKFIDSLKCNVDNFNSEPRYIRCESFSLEGRWDGGGTNIVDLPDSLKWLERNVRAEKIYIPRINCNETYVLVSNFLLDRSEAKQCASKNMYIWASDSVAFLKTLIQKFHTIPLVESAIPTIVFSYPRAEEHRAHLGPKLIDQDVEPQAYGEYDANCALYMISNGQNRMRISLSSRTYYCNIYRCNISIYSI